MKKTLLLLIFATCAASAQTTASLQTDLKKLYTAFDDIDIETLAQMLCTADQPALYDKIDHYFQSDRSKFRYVMHTVGYKLGKAATADGRTYIPVSFRNVVRITYFQPIDVSAQQQMLKENFHAESVSYEKSRNAFLVSYPCKMIAVGDGGKWLFVFADGTLPEEIGAGCVPDAIKNSLSF